MQYEVFTIPAGGGDEAEELNKFLRSHRVMGVIIAMLLLLSCCGRSWAVVIREDVNLAAATSLAASYGGVGWLEVEEGASKFRGTGVMVAEDWVLTAAHNWQNASVTGMQFTIAGNSYAAESWVQHPGWTGSVGAGQGWDIGLIHLSSPVLGNSPATIYGGSAELGKDTTIIGAGRVGTPSGGLDFNAAATLYGFTNTIDRVIPTNGAPGEGGLLVFDFDDGSAAKNTLGSSGIFNTAGQSIPSPAGTLSQTSSTSQTSHEGTTAGGDSGGPAFADFGNGPELIGLVSWGVNPTDSINPYGSGYGDVSHLTRVSAFDEWITTTIPEPSTAGMVILGACLCVNRRR